MSPSHARRALLAAICTALLALAPSAFGAAQVRIGSGAATASGKDPIVVTRDGAVLSVARNRMRADNDPTAHAEMVAMRAAAEYRNARRALAKATGRRAGQLRRAVDELATTLQRTTTVLAQTRSRLAGVMPGSARRRAPRPTRTSARGSRRGRRH